MKKTVRHFTESILYDIEQTAKVTRLAAAQLFVALRIDLSSDEYKVLDVISVSDGICQRDLAKLILRDRANTGRILNSLEEKELIERFVDTKNNRLVKKMILTDKGHKKLHEINEQLENYTQTMLDEFSVNEIDNLQISLRQFRKNVETALKLNI